MESIQAKSYLASVPNILRRKRRFRSSFPTRHPRRADFLRTGGVPVLLFLVGASGPVAGAQESTFERSEPACEVAVTLGSDLGLNGELIFNKMPELSVFRDGRLFALDRGESTAYVFSREGELLSEFGGEGEGPGEFAYVIDHHIAGDSVFLKDLLTGRLSAFRNTGELISDRRIDLASEIRSDQFWPLRGGKYLIVPSLSTSGMEEMDKKEVWFRILVGGGDDGALDTLAVLHSGILLWPDPRSPRPRPVPVSLGTGGRWVLSGDSLLVVVDSYTGHLRWLSSSSSGVTLERETDLGWEPIPIPPWKIREAESLVEQLYLTPRHRKRPARIEFLPHRGIGNSTGIFLSTEDQLWLNRLLPETLAEGTKEKHSWLVFERGGDFPAKEVILPDGFLLQAVNGERFWGTQRTKLGAALIVGLDCQSESG